jgi:hypothetical protein
LVLHNGNGNGNSSRNGNGNGHVSSASPLILIVARVPDKAHDVLLESFALLRDELKEWRLASSAMASS